MSNKLMGLFFEQTNDGDKKPKKEESVSESSNKFPTNFPTQPTPTQQPNGVNPQPNNSLNGITSNPMCEPHLEKIVDLYEKGFDTLNKEGYDFYEFFQSVIQGGATNPMIYQMALNVGKGVNPNITKDTLLNDANFYQEEITKVYDKYVSNGTSKKDSVLSKKESEKTSLTNELSDIDAELQRLTNLKSEKMVALSQIDGNYQEELTDIDCKLMANEVAKDRLMESIQTVINGITTNIQ